VRPRSGVAQPAQWASRLALLSHCYPHDGICPAQRVVARIDTAHNKRYTLLLLFSFFTPLSRSSGASRFALQEQNCGNRSTGYSDPTNDKGGRAYREALRWRWLRGWLFRLAGRLGRNGYNGLGQHPYRAAIGIDDLCGAAGVGDNCVAGAGLSRVVNHTVALTPIDQDLSVQDLNGRGEALRG
jgi:hypothetical protein